MRGCRGRARTRGLAVGLGESGGGFLPEVAGADRAVGGDTEGGGWGVGRQGPGGAGGGETGHAEQGGGQGGGHTEVAGGGLARAAAGSVAVQARAEGPSHGAGGAGDLHVVGGALGDGEPGGVQPCGDAGELCGRRAEAPLVCLRGEVVPVVGAVWVADVAQEVGEALRVTGVEVEAGADVLIAGDGPCVGGRGGVCRPGPG